MKPDAYAKYYGNDFEAATKGWRPEVKWAYWSCIWHYRSHTHCTGLPADDDFLRRLCECDSQDWNRTRGLIFDNERFFKLREGKWHQDRAARDYAQDVSDYKAQCDRTAKARAANPDNQLGKQRTPVTAPVTAPVTGQQPKPKPKQEPYQEAEPKSFDKASAVGSFDSGKADAITPTKPTKLSKRQKEAANDLETILGVEWVNDAGKWIKRVKSNFTKFERVLAEVGNAYKEGRIEKSPAAYAEDAWKRFA